MNQYLFFTKSEMKDDKIRVGDWVRVRIVGFGSDEPPYKVESIEGDIYVVVYKDGSYRHEMRLERHKIEKL